jgi:hypothetical protein
MKRSLLILWAVLTLAIGGGAWWYLFSAGEVPGGQRPLAREDVFREAFQKNVASTRIVALFSPTTPADLAAAQYLQGLLMEYENNPLDTYVVWQPMTQSDWAPTTDAMARVSDPRVRQFWDKAKAIRPLVGEGQVFVYARGAGFENPAIRVTDWKADLPKTREFLGTPIRQRAK